MGKNTPKDFDVDAWLDGLSRPQRSVRVYQRGEIIQLRHNVAALIHAHRTLRPLRRRHR